MFTKKFANSVNDSFIKGKVTALPFSALEMLPALYPVIASPKGAAISSFLSSKPQDV
jgi:hypothetical protein